MSTKMNELKQRISFRWIKAADSGKTYLCPSGVAIGENGAKDEELRRVCADESLNPHND